MAKNGKQVVADRDIKAGEPITVKRLPRHLYYFDGTGNAMHSPQAAKTVSPEEKARREAEKKKRSEAAKARKAAAHTKKLAIAAEKAAKAATRAAKLQAEAEALKAGR